MSELLLFKKGKKRFKAPTEPGKMDWYEENTFLPKEAEALDTESQDLVQESFDLRFTTQGGMLILRKMTDAEQIRVKEIDDRLKDITVDVFLARITAWPWKIDNVAVPLTKENVVEYFSGRDGAEYLNNVMAWGRATRNPKPETANS